MEDFAAVRRLVQRRRRVAHDLALEDGAENGDAGGDADLSEGVVGARRHPAALRLNNGDGTRGQDRIDDADAEAAHDEAGEEHGPGRVRVGRAHQEKAAGDQEHADAQQAAASAHARSGVRQRTTTTKMSNVIGRKRTPAASGP